MLAKLKISGAADGLGRGIRDLVLCNATAAKSPCTDSPRDPGSWEPDRSARQAGVFPTTDERRASPTHWASALTASCWKRAESRPHSHGASQASLDPVGFFRHFPCVWFWALSS